jgi:predicted permease
MLRRVATFPPFVALLVALVLTPVTFPPRHGGRRWRASATRWHRWRCCRWACSCVSTRCASTGTLLCYGLGYKLLVCPALVVALLWLAGAGPDMVSRVSLIEASMPPMIGAAVVASQANLAPRLVSMMVGLGIPLGLCTAPAWLWLFGALGQ